MCIRDRGNGARSNEGVSARFGRWRYPQGQWLTGTAANGNGDAPNPTTTPKWNRNHSAWDGLSDEQRVTVYRLASGEMRFRNISKEDRIDLVGRVLRHLAADGKPVTAPKFDRLRPNWMPTAGAVVLLAESRKWQELLALTMEPTSA